jgi:chloride channel 7
MGDNVIFVRPVERVEVVHSIMQSCSHSNFPVIDKSDRNILYGTIGRKTLKRLLQLRAFGRHGIRDSNSADGIGSLQVEGQTDFPLVQWKDIETRRKFSHSIKIQPEDRNCFMDLRPYCNTAPITIHEASSVEVGLRCYYRDSVNVPSVVVVPKSNPALASNCFVPSIRKENL